MIPIYRCIMKHDDLRIISYNTILTTQLFVVIASFSSKRKNNPSNNHIGRSFSPTGDHFLEVNKPVGRMT